MKLSISNIAWTSEDDHMMYAFLQEAGFSGLEIAPTRIFSENPYEHLEAAADFSDQLKENFQLEISSMQSICFGRNEAIFGTKDEREAIFNYVKKSIDFAAAMHCNNLVFGSPKNRIIGTNQMDVAFDFFGKLGCYADSKGTVMALEPNPDIYGTNFINTTQQAIDFVKEAAVPGLKINLDFGTFLHNNESLDLISDHLPLMNHIHISEPYLEKIEHRELHRELAILLKEQQYDRFVSIEMKNLNDIEAVKKTVLYLKETFYAV
ncbi:hypothetical protein FNO01nite_07000 [Flavobacterium noncentrifugens]|uniref:Sugar phosphate isomerase/epimerase n=1 Tax=Flavobacterium noncentrifugens TaxID=1128970 RepID=A0A1G8SZM2_9FLAO|nr:sugar phosphate isomerase/epimerase family protein [Flavobacterium noncentrifugens]GEP50028.1 hypothetical protein FNO01nite_07000 [Flavobacterium noncentrifugens]SDJ34658.1 Sugar phosphate isomerase/epimerase [Flavobacterium noncentrifugens]